jgi:hypothetical protein
VGPQTIATLNGTHLQLDSAGRTAPRATRGRRSTAAPPPPSRGCAARAPLRFPRPWT